MFQTTNQVRYLKCNVARAKTNWIPLERNKSNTSIVMNNTYLDFWVFAIQQVIALKLG